MFQPPSLHTLLPRTNKQGRKEAVVSSLKPSQKEPHRCVGMMMRMTVTPPPSPPPHGRWGKLTNNFAASTTLIKKVFYSEATLTELTVFHKPPPPPPPPPASIISACGLGNSRPQQQDRDYHSLCVPVCPAQCGGEERRSVCVSVHVNGPHPWRWRWLWDASSISKALV